MKRRFMDFYSIAYHKNGLSSLKSSLSVKYLNLKDLEKDIRELQDEIIFYEKQIIEAEKQGKRYFDRESFLIEEIKKEA